MSEPDLSNVTNTTSTESDSTQDDHLLAKLILEILQTPEEYLPNLLQIVRLFRESVTLKPAPSDISEQKAATETLEANRLAQQHKALKELTRLWIDEGDEQEQTETWEYLRQALDEDRLANRPFFP
jgi:uncharacterized damage-inducible protein DinB